MIVNSHDSRRADRGGARERGARVPDIEIVPLAVDEAFAQAKRGRAATRRTPYFLYVGTIEPRKNMLFLLAVWRRLVERYGARTPRLVIAGRRGWENENIVDVLERSRQLAPFLAEASDLTDAGLARLMADARRRSSRPRSPKGSACRSSKAWRPARRSLVSDIAAHREVGEDYAIFADAIDGPAWVAAIEALMDETSDFRRERLAKIAGYRPLSWAAHVAPRAISWRARRLEFGATVYGVGVLHEIDMPPLAETRASPERRGRADVRPDRAVLFRLSRFRRRRRPAARGLRFRPRASSGVAFRGAASGIDDRRAAGHSRHHQAEPQSRVEGACRAGFHRGPRRRRGSPSASPLT